MQQNSAGTVRVAAAVYSHSSTCSHNRSLFTPTAKLLGNGEKLFHFHASSNFHLITSIGPAAEVLEPECLPTARSAVYLWIDLDDGPEAMRRVEGLLRLASVAGEKGLEILGVLVLVLVLLSGGRGMLVGMGVVLPCCCEGVAVMGGSVLVGICAGPRCGGAVEWG